MMSERLSAVFLWAAVVVGIIAAFCWFVSATTEIPIDSIMSGFGGLTGVKEVSEAMRKAAA